MTKISLSARIASDLRVGALAGGRDFAGPVNGDVVVVDREADGRKVGVAQDQHGNWLRSSLVCDLEGSR